MPTRKRHRGRGCSSIRRGFTLLEAMMASAILLGVVTAVTATITAGQQHSLETQNRVAASLASEALLARLVNEDYVGLSAWHGHTEAPGTMTDEYGQPMPQRFKMIGRRASVRTTLQEIDPPDVRIRGKVVTVTAFDHTGRDLISVSVVVVEPQ